MLAPLLRAIGPGGLPFIEYLGLGLKGGTDEAFQGNEVLVIENANSQNPQVSVQPRSTAVLTRTQVVELGLERARLLPHAVGSAVSTSPQIAYELLKPILDLSNAAGSNFRRGDLPRVTGTETQPSLAEMIQDYIAGANIQSGFPDPPPFMQPGLLTPISLELLEQLGQAGSGLFSQIWSLFNPPTTQPPAWQAEDGIASLGISGSVGINGATGTMTISSIGTRSGLSAGSCETFNYSFPPNLSLGPGQYFRLRTYTQFKNIPNCPGTSHILENQVYNADGTIPPNRFFTTSPTSSSWFVPWDVVITLTPIGAVTGSWESAFPQGLEAPGASGPYVPPTASDASGFTEPALQPTTPDLIAAQAGQQQQLNEQATTTTVGSNQETASPAGSPATAAPVVAPALAPLPAYLPAIGTALGTQTGTQTQTQPQAVPVTPATAVKIGTKLFDGSTAATSAVAVAQELLRIEKKLEAIMQPGDTPDIPWLDLLGQIANALSILSTGGTYSMTEFCPPHDQEPAVYEWPVPGVPLANLGVAARLDAIAEMLQVHKNLKQPICKTVSQGQPVQVQFIQSEEEWEPNP